MGNVLAFWHLFIYITDSFSRSYTNRQPTCPLDCHHPWHVDNNENIVMMTV